MAALGEPAGTPRKSSNLHVDAFKHRRLHREAPALQGVNLAGSRGTWTSVNKVL
eukprot:CAMPEP_0177519484 /NCGR_PEP_ID=MMETSP0369-20130122/47122_1 /TAXON_ID=447022 ORGANISM="Scrippsiella hangoei-like, Strain SHHI-4" /NCGR_SAMPLE_ID=MMETSP0369 /ASSEMBLY_ACC=CAM_ASM_000364 /LENGTH=53 /DNA_ID=CAMNT_0018998739 /DNA_START=390 /DNA_END=549 /DNA_ORIENTATION=-